MRTWAIQGRDGRCPVYQEASLQRLPELLAGGNAVAICDANVAALHGRRLSALLPLIILPPGEKHKNLAAAARLYGQLMKRQADRRTFILGIGGGVACDITGFVASTFLRGLDFGLLPTTLLAQTDAAIGGKNGVNWRGYKNMVGLVRQPRFVLCDSTFLRTLPRREVANGLAEIVKHAAIGGVGLFRLMEKRHAEIRRGHEDALAEVLARSLPVKIAIVNRDEQEDGERKKLNFGHTLGHALEKATGASHGRAVAAGMCFAAALSRRHAGLSAGGLARLQALLRLLGLPLRLPAPPRTLKAAILHDKKRGGGAIDMALLERIGRARIVPVPVAEIMEAVDDLR